MAEDTIFSFGEHLWDQLPRINYYSIQGRQGLQVLKQFEQVYTRTLTTFAEGLKECAQILNSETLLTHAAKAKYDTYNDHQPTLDHSVYMVIGGLQSLAAEVEERAHQTHVETCEPLENFCNNFTTQSEQKIRDAYELYLTYESESNKLNDYRQVYLQQKDVAEKSDLRIEESMLEFERGEIDVEKV